MAPYAIRVKDLVSKATVVLRRWENKKSNISSETSRQEFNFPLEEGTKLTSRALKFPQSEILPL